MMLMVWGGKRRSPQLVPPPEFDESANPSEMEKGLPHKFGFIGSGQGRNIKNHEYIIPQALDKDKAINKDNPARIIFVDRKFANSFLGAVANIKLKG